MAVLKLDVLFGAFFSLSPLLSSMAMMMVNMETILMMMMLDMMMLMYFGIFSSGCSSLFLWRSNSVYLDFGCVVS